MILEGDGHYEIPQFSLVDEGWYLYTVREVKWGDPPAKGPRSLQVSTTIAEGELDGQLGPMLFIREEYTGQKAMAALLIATGLKEAWQQFPVAMKPLDELSVERAQQTLVSRAFM